MDIVVKIDDPSLHTDIMKLQAAIKQGLGDLAAARSMVEQCPSDDIDTMVNEVSRRCCKAWQDRADGLHASRLAYSWPKNATRKHSRSSNQQWLSGVSMAGLHKGGQEGLTRM